MNNPLEKLTLDEISEKFVDLSYPEGDEELKKMMEFMFRQELEKKITLEQKQKIRLEVEKEIEVKSEQEKISNLKVLIFEVVFLSFLVGILVNQVTDIITYLKTSSYEKYSLWITSGIILLTLGIGYLMVLYKFVITALSIKNGLSKK